MLLEVEGLTKTYRGGVRANDGLTLHADAGEVYGLLGHNGAGKTTLANQIVGLLRPDAGTIRIAGRDAIADPAWARQVCSIQPQAQVPITGLTPRVAIDLIGRLRGGRPEEVRERVRRLADALEIGEWLDMRGEKLSGGVKRLVSFCMAAVTPGRIVILDEPTNDVDPVRRRLLWAQVRALADEGAAVLLVTHNVVEAERSVDRLSLMDHGHVVAEGTPSELKARLSDDLRLALVLDPTVAPPSVPPFARHAAVQGSRLVAAVPADHAADAAAWAQALRFQGWVEEFSLEPATLEDLYVEVLGNGSAPALSLQEERDVRVA